MFARNVWRVLFVVVLIAGLLTSVEPAKALGTPQIISINPPSGSPVGSNVCIRAQVTWDSDFRSMRIRFGNEGWNESAEINFERCFGTGNLSPGWYKIRVEVAKVNEDWGSATSTEADYELTANQPAPQPQPQPQSASCSVDSFDVWPNPANVGDSVHVSGSGSCNTGVRATKVRLDGDNLYEIGSSKLEWDWNTSRVSAGQHKLVLWVAGQGDNNWSSAAKSAPIYVQLNTPGQSSGNQSPFSTGNIINISGDIYVTVVSDKGAVEKRHVPNPDTLDALGIPRAWIDNKGLSNAELIAIHRGDDIPDINRDPSGFAAFKAKYFPNTTPIQSGSTNQQPQNPAGPGILIPFPQGPTGSTGPCPNAPTMVKPGDIAIITDFSATDASLNIRNNPSLDADTVGKIPIGAQFTIIAGPICANKIRWYEVGYNGIDGWSAEVAKDGQYNFVPNGYVPAQNSSAENSSNNPVPTEAPFVDAGSSPAVLTPVVPEGQQPQTSETQPSQGSDFQTWWCSNIHLFCGPVLAAELVNTTCTYQCVPYAHALRPDLDKWASGAGTSDNILAIAQKMPSFMYQGQQQQVRVRASDEAPQFGDLVIWPSGCDGAWNNGGHIGYNSANGSIKMTDSNWDYQAGPTCSTRSNKPIPTKSCMRFITSPYPYLQPDLSMPQEDTPSATPKGNIWDGFWHWLTGN